MPFQDVDEVSVEQTRAPSGVERILRKTFVEDWSLKLLSLSITLVLWLLVTSQNQPVITHVNVQLNFIRPQSLEISNDPPKVIDVELSGSRNKLDHLSAPDLIATLDITDLSAGERMLRLSERAQLSLPHGIKILNFTPAAIPVRLEEIIEKELKVEPRVEGKLADGFEVYSTSVSQPTVTVRGPASRLNALEKAPTETIWLAGQKNSFSASKVSVDLSDPKVEILDGPVSVQLDIGEKRSEKIFANVPVESTAGGVSPNKASVTVFGPAHDLGALKSEDIKIVLNDSLEPRLEVPTAFQGRVTLKSLSPSKFSQAK